MSFTINLFPEPEKEYLFSLTVSYGDDSSVVFTHKYFVPGPAHVQISAVALGPYQVKLPVFTLLVNNYKCWLNGLAPVLLAALSKINVFSTLCK